MKDLVEVDIVGGMIDIYEATWRADSVLYLLSPRRLLSYGTQYALT